MTEEEPEKIPTEQKRGGVWITIGEVQYRIPPLGFLDVQELQAEIEGLQSIAGIPSREQMQTVVKITHAAIRRNYPSLSFEAVGQMLDLGNFQPILFAVLTVSGFERSAAPKGEAPASTGPESMPH